jgi:hypothetical protein
MAGKSKPEFKYDITEVLGVASPEADLTSAWCKAVLKTLFNEEEDGIDIRNFNRETKLMGKGVRLNIQEAHNLTDILVANGYGSMEVLEKEYKRRRSLLDD